MMIPRVNPTQQDHMSAVDSNQIMISQLFGQVDTKVEIIVKDIKDFGCVLKVTIITSTSDPPIGTIAFK